MHYASSHLSDFTDVVSKHFRSHEITGPDRIVGNLEARSFGSIGLTRLSYGARMEVKTDPLGSFALLQIPIHGRASEPAAGERHLFGLAEGQVLSPTRPIDFAMHRNCTLLITRFDRDDMETMLAALSNGEESDDRIHALWRCDLTTPAGNALVSQLKWLNFELFRPDSALERMGLHFSNNLLASFLLAAIPELTSVEGKLPTTSVLRRVEAYMDAHFQEPLSVADLAQVAGVPVRSLYDLFKRYKSQSPAELLRKKRLNASRDMLLSADPEEMTVTEAAMACGFTHLGRFAEYYRAEFGETPSTTLSKRRRWMAIQAPPGIH